MCGISGVYLKNRTSQRELGRMIGAMDDIQNRRGPDDRGNFFDSRNNLALGHRRLSFIDLSKAGHQPMSYRQQELWITFNGEIYNFPELKKELIKKGYKFATKTDTEVILALYAEYGEKSFDMLRGMFAFGLWDKKLKKLYLVKDRYGIKPLYYWSDKNKLIFASTVKALEKSGAVPVEKNIQALIGFLIFGSVPLPMTTIKNVLAVPAGHYLIRDSDGGEKLVKYYEPLDFFKNKGDAGFEEAVREIRNILGDAVKIHLVSDAPLGVFLSGGLDSSTIAALAAGQTKKPLNTLSVVFDEKEFSEEAYQRLVAGKIGSNHAEIKITSRDFFDSFPKIFEAMDQPTVDGVNTFFIAQAAKKAGLKAVLSGLGADEIFFGYPAFRRIDLLKIVQGFPGYLKYPLKFSTLLGSRYAKSEYFLRNDALGLYLGIRSLFVPKKAAEILGIDEIEVNRFIEELALEENIAGLSGGDLLSWLEIKFYLQNQLLKDTDFMAMHHSVEVRVPFLDHKLVEYVSELSIGLKISGDINKPLLAQAAAGLVPEEIIKRRKMGFTFPFAQWLKEAPPGIIPSSLSTSDLFGKFQDGRYHWSRFWAGLVLNEFIK